MVENVDVGKAISEGKSILIRKKKDERDFTQVTTSGSRRRRGTPGFREIKEEVKTDKTFTPVNNKAPVNLMEVKGLDEALSKANTAQDLLFQNAIRREHLRRNLQNIELETSIPVSGDVPTFQETTPYVEDVKGVDKIRIEGSTVPVGYLKADEKPEIPKAQLRYSMFGAVATQQLPSTEDRAIEKFSQKTGIREIETVGLFTTGAIGGFMSAGKETILSGGFNIVEGTAGIIADPSGTVEEISKRVSTPSGAGEFVGEQLFFGAFGKGVSKGVPQAGKVVEGVREARFEKFLEKKTPTEPSVFSPDRGFVTSEGALQTQLKPKPVDVAAWIGDFRKTTLGETQIPENIFTPSILRVVPEQTSLSLFGAVDRPVVINTAKIGAKADIIAIKSELPKPTQTTLGTGTISLKDFQITVIEASKGKGVSAFGSDFFSFSKRGQASLNPLQSIFEPGKTRFKVVERSLKSDRVLKADVKPLESGLKAEFGGKLAVLTKADVDVDVFTKRKTKSKTDVLPDVLIAPSPTKSLVDVRVAQRTQVDSLIKPPVGKTDTRSRVVTLRDVSRLLKGSSSTFSRSFRPPLIRENSFTKLETPTFKTNRDFFRNAFNVLVKEKGVYKLVGKGLTRESALGLGAKRTKGSLAASFKLVRTSGKGEDLGFRTGGGFGEEFRSFRLVGGKKVPLVDEFIQRRRYRLGTKKERKAIQKAKKSQAFFKKSKGKVSFI